MPTILHNNDEKVPSTCMLQAQFQATSASLLLGSSQQPRGEYIHAIIIIIPIALIGKLRQDVG